MRALPQTLSTRLARQYTAPVCLLQIDLPGQPLRFTSRGAAVVFDGSAFDRVCDDVQIDDVGGGGLAATARLDNAAGDLTPLFFGADPRRSRTRVWRGDDAEFVMVFDGYLGACNASDGWIGIEAGSGGNYAIDVTIAPPFVTHLTPPGTIVQIGGETFVLESE